MSALKKAKPSAAKGSFIRKITVTSTMGPNKSRCERALSMEHEE
jgi:ribosomal protein L1